MTEDKIPVMLVDDEQEAIDYLSILLREKCPQVEIVATATQAADALSKVYRHHPMLLFLDIKMDGKNGFEIAAEIQKENHSPHIVFVTAYDKYAIDAFKANAMDYLLKPVDPVELERVVIKFRKLNEIDFDVSHFKSLISTGNSRIRFNTRTGYILIDPGEVVYCQSDGNYSEIILQDDTSKTVTFNLGSVHQLLPEPAFKRISRFHIIHEKFLREVDRSKHECVLQYGNHKISLPYSNKVFND